MRAYVTGSRGYLGVPICNRLKEEGHTVIEFSGRVESDPILYSMPIDAVIHLAAENDLYAAEKYPYRNYLVNYWGAVRAMNFARERGARFVFASTDTVVLPDGVPVSVYDRHKFAAEQAIKYIPSMDAVILRMSTVYGTSLSKSPQANRGIVNQWCRKALSGEVIGVYRGVGDRLRDFVHIGDVVEAFVASLKINRGTYGVCTGIGTSIREMAGHICDMTFSETGTFCGVEYIGDPKDLHPIELRSSVSDYHLLEWESGWRPRIDVFSGLKKTIRSFAGIN